MPAAPHPNALAKLGLGTAQFGIDYGVTNPNGQMPVDQVGIVVSKALLAGIDLFDTAPGYGESESVLGSSLPKDWAGSIVTKTPAVGAAVIGEEEIRELDRCFARSLARLKRDRAYALLLHRPDDLRKVGAGRLIDWMQGLKVAGKVAKIGVSVYTGVEIDAVFDLFAPDIVQAPFSLADQRLIATGHFAELKKSGVEIHVRSLFLQGLLLADPTLLPMRMAPFQAALTGFAAAAGRSGFTPLEACLAFALGWPEVDRAIVGVASAREFEDILAACRRIAGRVLDATGFALSDERLLDPRVWPASS